MTRIHPTAMIDSRAELADDVEVGAYAVIGPDVRVGPGSSIAAHVVIEGPTVIGRDNRIYPGASVGAAPQDKKYAGEPTSLEIGDGNTIREFCTLNRGTAQDKGYTRIGDDNWIMAYTHVAHDCVIGSHTIIANSTNLAGHVEVGDWVLLGGATQVRQFVRIGAHAMTAATSLVLQEVPPYVMTSGNPAGPHGINSEGLRRRGYSAEQIAAVRRAYRSLYRKGLSLEDACREIAAEAEASADAATLVAPLLEFLAKAERGIVR